MNKYTRFAAAALIAAVVAVPSFAAARGSANFQRFVTLGDSYGVGYSNGSMNERHQPWSWPAIVAKQVGLSLCPVTAVAADNCFAQPLVSFPGFGPELQLVNFAPTILPAPGQAQPLMTQFGRPYNNLSIPGATVGAMLSLTGAEPPQSGEPGAVTAGRFILRGLGTPIQQAVAQHPTFIAVWIGGNDYLNVVATGTPATLTPAADFKARYEAMLDGLIAGAPSAGMVVGNLPMIVPPYLTLVPPMLVDPATRQPILVGGQMVFFMVDNGDGTSSPIAIDTLLPLQTRAKLAQGYGLPAVFKNIPPFNQLPHVGEPLSPNDVITKEELAQVFARVAEYNTAIQQAAAARNIPVADINGLFQRVHAQGGIALGPVSVTSAFITGGFYGFDGVHLTDLGYLLFANEYIKAINAGYGADIPLASISQLFANNGANFQDGFSLTTPADASLFSTQSIMQIHSFWTPTPAPAPRRFRTIGH